MTQSHALHDAMQAPIQAGSRVVNIGSGLGGPARYLAGTCGCVVLACELQDDLHQSAAETTRRCHLVRVSAWTTDCPMLQRIALMCV